MSGLALVARELGADVTASDRGSSIFTATLREAGLDVVIGHSADHVPPNAEIVISAAVPTDNMERRIARERGQQETFRSDLLAELTRLRSCVAVAGTHGKTTTTAMLVHILHRCGLDPAFVIGGLLRSAGGHAHWGDGVLVIEADESDRSLLKYDVDIAVLLNAELDHHAHYDDDDQVRTVFRNFLAGAPQAVIGADPSLLELRDGPYVRSTLATDRVIVSGRQRFSFEHAAVDLPMPGAHNAENALVALRTATLLGADADAAAAALADFPGIARRLEFAGRSAAGAHVFDDYGHHPTEVRAALHAARELTTGRLVAVFQPHLCSRTEHFAQGFADALGQADLVVVCDVYPARECAEDWPGVTAQLIVEAISSAGRAAVRWTPTLDDAAAELERELTADDLCIVVGAGDIGTLVPRLVAGVASAAVPAG
jgi:UDP-N-acetylmuramate--alanine ligase